MPVKKTPAKTVTRPPSEIASVSAKLDGLREKISLKEAELTALQNDFEVLSKELLSLLSLSSTPSMSVSKPAKPVKQADGEKPKRGPRRDLNAIYLKPLAEAGDAGIAPKDLVKKAGLEKDNGIGVYLNGLKDKGWATNKNKKWFISKAGLAAMNSPKD